MPYNPSALPIGSGSSQADGGTPERGDTKEEITCPNCEGDEMIWVGEMWICCPDCSGTGRKVVEA